MFPSKPFPRAVAGTQSDNPPEPVAEPVEGSRGWNLRHDPLAGWEIVGIGVSVTWKAEPTGSSRSECHARLFTGETRHDVRESPVKDCSCGFYLVKGEGTAPAGVTVEGRAVGWGRVVEHQHGWRCQWARPTLLRVNRTRLLRTFPKAEPAEVARALERRYRCAVELFEGPDDGVRGLWSAAKRAIASPAALIAGLLLPATVATQARFGLPVTVVGCGALLAAAHWQR
jgi:hypothetical protein